MPTPAILLPYIDPEIFSLDLGAFRFTLRWYSLSYIAGFLIAWYWFVRIMKRPDLWPDNQPPMAPSDVERLLTWNIIGIVTGGRLGYVLLYNPSHYLEWPLEVLMIWQGGMSFHGAFVGLILTTSLFCRRCGIPLGSVSDTISIVVTPGLALGRLANFINMELYGRPTDSPLGVVFPAGPGATCPPDWPGICARHPTQLYEAALEGVLLCCIMCFLAYRRSWFKWPWRIAAVFFTGYGLARFMVEFLRQPDSQFVTANSPTGQVIDLGMLGGLTMGQLLSLPMIIIGLFLFRLSVRRQG